MSSSQHTTEKNLQLTSNGPVIKKKKMSKNDSVSVPEVQSDAITVAGTLTNVPFIPEGCLTTVTDSPIDQIATTTEADTGEKCLITTVYPATVKIGATAEITTETDSSAVELNKDMVSFMMYI